jgi:hypothetical protein
MTTLEVMQPYVERLFDDSEVHQELSRAARNLRAARSRAGKAKSKKQLVQDEQLRRRLAGAIRAGAAVTSALAEAPRQQRRSHTRRRLLLLTLLAAGGAAAASPDARAWVQSRVAPFTQGGAS